MTPVFGCACKNGSAGSGSTSTARRRLGVCLVPEAGRWIQSSAADPQHGYLLGRENRTWPNL